MRSSSSGLGGAKIFSGWFLLNKWLVFFKVLLLLEGLYKSNNNPRMKPITIPGIKFSALKLAPNHSFSSFSCFHYHSFFSITKTSKRKRATEDTHKKKRFSYLLGRVGRAIEDTHWALAVWEEKKERASDKVMGLRNFTGPVASECIKRRRR